MRTLDGVALDWPIGYADLEPYYDLNDRMMGVAGLAGDPANPPRRERPTRPLPLGPAVRRLVGGFEGLGWHWWPSDAAIVSTSYGPGRLVTAAYNAYYTDGRVLAVLERLTGYEARPPQPLGHVLEPFDDSLLERERARAPFWRRTDDMP